MRKIYIDCFRHLHRCRCGRLPDPHAGFDDALPSDADPHQQGLCLYRRVAAVRDQHEEQDLFCVHRAGEGRHPAPYRRREIHDPALERSGRERPRDDVADDDEPRQPPPDQGAAHRRRAHFRRV